MALLGVRVGPGEHGLVAALTKECGPALLVGGILDLGCALAHWGRSSLREWSPLKPVLFLLLLHGVAMRASGLLLLVVSLHVLAMVGEWLVAWLAIIRRMTARGMTRKSLHRS